MSDLLYNPAQPAAIASGLDMREVRMAEQIGEFRVSNDALEDAAELRRRIAALHRSNTNGK